MLLKEALAMEAPDSELETVDIASDEEAIRCAFLGSPSIQINGLDIEKGRRKDPPFYGCRLYRTEKGSRGIPPIAMIIEAIREAKLIDA